MLSQTIMLLLGTDKANGDHVWNGGERISPNGELMSTWDADHPDVPNTCKSASSF